VLHASDELLAAVARLHAPQARGAIEDLAALGRVVVHPLGAREQARRLLELAGCRERHEERRVLERGGDGRVDGFWAGSLVHGGLLASLPAMVTQRNVARGTLEPN